MAGGRPGPPFFISFRRRLLDLSRWKRALCGARIPTRRGLGRRVWLRGVGVAASLPDPTPGPLGLCGRGRPLSGPECPSGLPELEGEKLAMAPAPPLPGPGGPPARSGLLPCPGRGAAQGQGRFSPLRPAVLPGAPPPPRSPFGPVPTLPAGARAPSWPPNLAYLASRRRLGVWLSLWAPPQGSHLAPSRSPLLTPPPVPSPLRPRAANPSGLRASSPGRATGSS